MRRNSYYPIRQGDQVTWLITYAGKLPTYATALGLTTTQVSTAIADCLWLAYVLQKWLNAARNWSLGCTAAANTAQTGSGTEPMDLPVFDVPPLPTGVLPTPPGALNRIFALVQQIKNDGKLTDAIADELGIVGSEATGPDLATVQPKIEATVSGSVVNLKWGWGGNAAWLEACEILVDRADGKGFVLLTIDTTPNYTDTQTFPPAKAIWTYKAIYRANDAQVGVWSSLVSVTVGA